MEASESKWVSKSCPHNSLQNNWLRAALEGAPPHLREPCPSGFCQRPQSTGDGGAHHRPAAAAAGARLLGLLHGLLRVRQLVQQRQCVSAHQAILQPRTAEGWLGSGRACVVQEEQQETGVWWLPL